VLAVEAMHEAITNYEEKHGMFQDKVPTTVEIVQRRLKTVMNPLAGLDIVRTEMVKDIKVEDGVVAIELDLAANNLFAANIEEEIHEKIGNMWDVKEVKIKLGDPV
jgi:nitrogen fixation protein NifU and related proteins